ncbi:UbiA family prenyltransferase [Compostimonas suwonensis]|uniref:4-hydroxybenzoate polyprenyltransferase n=1 Tax=Compostimonas suwonensis TaxID=1048394 RepID=A0A2M9BZA3_9MICO|nr:UbiA family prenyltransferase [Compostimonas suwonensis]PJJ63408.1 4-hydroxybenzoate polyprenyltransferase [Compostimonas suwonensis]
MPSTVSALLRSSHPGPCLAVTALAIILAVGIGAPPLVIVVLALAVFAGQLSVGLSNDWLDADRDRQAGRADKPIARGWISVSAVRTAAVATLAAAVLLSFLLGFFAGAAHTIALVSAWAYNAVLKNSALSVLPYALSFGLLATVPGFALPQPSLTAWWVIAFAALLGSAAHFANVLPDLDDDRRTGIRGLPHRLGRRVSGVTAFVLLAAASIIVVFASGTEPGILSLAGLGLDLVIAIAGVVHVLTRPSTRLLFQLIIASAIVNVVLLATAGSRILV